MTISNTKIMSVLTKNCGYSKTQISICMKAELNGMDMLQNHVYIINMDHEDGTGTHWIVLLCPMSKACFYIDSFAADPPDEVIRFVRREGCFMRLASNTYRMQDFQSTNCGYYCIAAASYCLHSLKSESQPEFANLVDSFIDMFGDNTRDNEVTLYTYLIRHFDTIPAKCNTPLSAFDGSLLPFKPKKALTWRK